MKSSHAELASYQRVARQRRALQLAVVAGQAAMIAVTWPLWQARVEPPLLPIVALPAWSFGVPLLATLALAVVRPCAGVLAHWGLLALAIAADQTREQAPVLSLAVLLVATLPVRGAREIAVLHLAALWFWSGVGKLTSERFLTIGGAWLLDANAGDGVVADRAAAFTAGASVGIAEVALAVLVLLPRTRGAAAWLACALHAVILLFLVGRGWNAVVWPWNASLAIAALVLLSTVDGNLAAMLGRGLAVRVAAVAFLALPIGFHVGVVDAPFAHQVYTANSHRALALRSDGRTEVVGELSTLGVSLPPVRRILEAWFARTARPRDRLLLVDDRPLAGLAAARETIVPFASEARP